LGVGIASSATCFY